MAHLSNKAKILIAWVVFFSAWVSMQSCQKEGMFHADNNIQMQTKLSSYKIFKGKLSDLIPSDSFHMYEIPTQLFSDYAEKQRLVKVPTGSKIIAIDNGLPDFPEGTVLVKTFFYYNDRRDFTKGKKIIETRLLVKSKSTWNIATYLWNSAQTDADLMTTGINKTVNWVDDDGNKIVISFHVPSNGECATCHHSDGYVVPIGPKIRNWNIDVVRNNQVINQLVHFQHSGILNIVNPANFLSLPDWKNTSLPLEQRSRAYLDINCAHCHNPAGFAGDTRIIFSYETPFGETKIGKVRNAIIEKMSSGQMPKLGTTVVDQKGLELIKQYIKSL